MSNEKLFNFIQRCTNPNELRKMIRNAQSVIQSGSQDLQSANDNLIAARDRLWVVSAEKHKPTDDIERALLVALYAYENVLSDAKGKQVYARRIRNKMNEVGIIAAATNAVLKGNTQGLNKLKEWNRLSASFEAVIIKHKSKFSADVVAAAKRNLEI